MLVKITEPIQLADNFALIPLTHGKVAIVDPAMLEELSKHKWKAVRSSHCWYAVRDIIVDGIEDRVRMHRVIMCCPPDMIVHHINRRSLDNRKSNLKVMAQGDHQNLHNFIGHGRNAQIPLQVGNSN
jgi:hypothetical protein